ncbi:MAG: TIGR00266 family protein [Planctomycetes bacterium]|nr:TIGR00266 family protein [Planctomycetota bacterium]
MKYEIKGNPDYGDLLVHLDPDDSILVESGAMSRMSPHLTLKARLLGGVIRAVARKFLGGESLFITEYTAPAEGFVALSPTLPGTIGSRQLDGGSFFLTAGSFLACTPGVELRTRFGGLRGFFSGEGAFLVECSGEGIVFFNAYGAILKKEVQGTLTVDTGHVVAWEPGLDYQIRGMGGLKSTMFSGEGLVMAFQGTGSVYVQTRHLGAMAGWLAPFCHG